MKSLLAARLGVQEPQIVHLPPDVASLAAAEEAIELANAYGVCGGFPLDESQQFTLRAGLGERGDGTWAAATVADFEPRQQGKNDTCAARELAGLVLFGERLILHTAHEFPTANESFLRLVAVFENWDDLRRRVARIRYANGEQGIEFRTGQRLKYRARTGGSGRGFAEVDLTVYDEAQHMQPEHAAASGPARLANANSQAWYMGSGGISTSQLAWRMRKRALTGGAGRFAYVEHTAEQVSLVDGRVVTERPDPLDRDAWARANPAYGRRVSDESLMALYDELGPDLFARECLCLWDLEPGSETSVIPAESWAACLTDGAWDNAGTAYALDVSPDARSCAIAAADGTHVEIVKHSTGIGWVVASCVARRDRFREIILDPAGPAGQLVAPLEAVGITVRRVSTEEAKAACASFLTSVVERSLIHMGQRELDEAVTNADRRDVGDGGWLWSRRRSTVDIAPLYASTLAKWGAGVSAGPSVYEDRGLVSL